SGQQRARFGVELAKAQEIGGQAARQNGEVALHVTRGHARRLALETATAGRKPRVAAGLREDGRSAWCGENRHGASSRRPKTHGLPILSSGDARTTAASAAGSKAGGRLPRNWRRRVG